jgi:hypothetical protein
MRICKVCKCENEDQFVYCKNCGAMLEVIPPVKPVQQEPVEVTPEVQPISEIKEAPVSVPVQNTASVVSNPYENAAYSEPQVSYSAPVTNAPTLVPVKMLLPEPTNPEIKTIQTVYVTPAQKAAIQYDMLKNK